jgi:hypothetical protein
MDLPLGEWPENIRVRRAGARVLCLLFTVPNENAVWPRKNRFFSEYASVVSDICWGSQPSRQERRRVSAVRQRYQEVNLRQRGRFSGYSGSRLSFIAMMQPADLGYRHNSPHFRRLDRSWQG